MGHMVATILKMFFRHFLSSLRTTTQRDTYQVGSDQHYYNPALCARNCNEITDYNRISNVNPPPYINGAYPKCNMFAIFEDVLGGNRSP